MQKCMHVKNSCRLILSNFKFANVNFIITANHKELESQRALMTEFKSLACENSIAASHAIIYNQSFYTFHTVSIGSFSPH